MTELALPPRDRLGPSRIKRTLLHLLADHSPADASEARSLSEIRALIEADGDPFSRHRFEPGHLTASAVVVDSTGTRALLIFHDKLQLWLQPGGHFEPGETDPLACAIREVLEETGLHATSAGLLDVDVHSIPARKTDPEHRHFDLRFLLVAQTTDAAPGDGTSAVRWVDLPTDLDLDPGLRRALTKVTSSP